MPLHSRHAKQIHSMSVHKPYTPGTRWEAEPITPGTLPQLCSLPAVQTDPQLSHTDTLSQYPTPGTRWCAPSAPAPRNSTAQPHRHNSHNAPTPGTRWCAPSAPAPHNFTAQPHRHTLTTPTHLTQDGVLQAHQRPTISQLNHTGTLSQRPRT